MSFIRSTGGSFCTEDERGRLDDYRDFRNLV